MAIVNGNVKEYKIKPKHSEETEFNVVITTNRIQVVRQAKVTDDRGNELSPKVSGAFESTLGPPQPFRIEEEVRAWEKESGEECEVEITDWADPIKAAAAEIEKAKNQPPEQEQKRPKPVNLTQMLDVDRAVSKPVEIPKQDETIRWADKDKPSHYDPNLTPDAYE